DVDIPRFRTVTLTNGQAHNVTLEGTLSATNSTFTINTLTQSNTGQLNVNGTALWNVNGLELAGGVNIVGATKTAFVRCSVAPNAGTNLLYFSSIPSDWAMAEYHHR